MLDSGDIPLEWREFDIPKKHGGVRHISAPCEELKAAQRQIKAYLEKQAKIYDQLAPTYFAHGFVPFRCTITGVQLHDWNAQLFLCTDIEDFFDNMPVYYVSSKLLEAGLSFADVNTIIRLCTYKGRFPQGGPCSPMLMNIGMRECDMMISSFAKAHGFTYSRYADDITLGYPVGLPKLTAKSIAYAFDSIEAVLRTKLGLRLKKEKNHVIHMKSQDAQQITGVVVGQNGVGLNAPRDMRRKARAMCHNLYKLARTRGSLESLWPKWAKLKGYVSYMDHIRFGSRSEARQTADPIIKEDEFEYLQRRFGK